MKLYFFGVYSPSLLASVCFLHFCAISFQLFSYFVWLRINDGGSVLEMRIWFILLSLFFLYCKSQAFTLSTLKCFCKIYAQTTFFVLAGGGVNFNISSSLYFHFAIKFRLLLSICGLHFWCPLNLKMLPTPLFLLRQRGRLARMVFDLVVCRIPLHYGIFASPLLLDFSVDVGAFVIGLSQISSFSLVTRPFRWLHIMTLTLTFDLLQG